MIAIDTNLLIYAHRMGCSEHKMACAAIERALSTEGCGFSLPTVAEFWSVVTHDKVERSPNRHRKAREFLEELSSSGVEIWGPGNGFGERLSQLAEELSVSGARIFDLQIGLIAFENGATEIWTHDQRFRPPPGLRVVDPPYYNENVVSSASLKRFVTLPIACVASLESFLLNLRLTCVRKWSGQWPIHLLAVAPMILGFGLMRSRE